MGYAVWASHTSVLPVCLDARRRGKGNVLSTTKYPGGGASGQAGWDFGVRYSGLSDLATVLGEGVAMPASYCGNWWDDCKVGLASGQIDRLAINAHGVEGELQINGPSATGITAANVTSYHAALDKITPYLSSTASVLLMGCLAGKGQDGSDLLIALSNIWSGRRVVGFSTIGYRAAGDMKQTGETCLNPGMRDTSESSAWSESAMDKAFKADWYDLSKLPWASGTSPHAKVAQYGSITKWPDGELVSSPAKVPSTPVTVPEAQGPVTGARRVVDKKK